MFSELTSITSDLWLLPEGVEELLPPDAMSAEDLRRQLIDLYSTWGYQLVVPPLMEYLDSLLTGVGQDLELETFKLTDQITGKLLGIRADMTPQVSRIDARNHSKGAHRLCYIGSVLRTRTSNLYPTRTPIQTGCEIYGIADNSADIEVISMMLETLRKAKINHIHMDLAHVGIYQHIISKADLPEVLEKQLISALQRKSVPEVETLMKSVNDEQAKQYILAMLSLAGGPEMLVEAKALFKQDETIMSALEEVEYVYQVMSERFPEVEFYIDLCEMRGAHYHTGLVFAAYTQGLGHAIAEGGRYDGVGSEFGNARPATGFSADLRALLQLGQFEVRAQGKAIVAPASQDKALWRFVQSLREQEKVIQCMPGEQVQDWQHTCDRQIQQDADGQWVVVDL